MTDSAESNDQVTEVISQLSDASMADTIGMLMQNATTIQQSMQTIANTSTSSTCAMILSLGGGGGGGGGGLGGGAGGI